MDIFNNHLLKSIIILLVYGMSYRDLYILNANPCGLLFQSALVCTRNTASIRLLSVNTLVVILWKQFRHLTALDIILPSALALFFLIVLLWKGFLVFLLKNTLSRMNSSSIFTFFLSQKEIRNCLSLFCEALDFGIYRSGECYTGQAMQLSSPEEDIDLMSPWNVLTFG